MSLLKHMLPSFNNKSGLTLLELLLASALLMIVLAIIFSAYFVSVRVFSEQTGQTDLFWNGQTAVATMTKELRESRQIVSAEANSITFWWKDLNGDTTRGADETVTFSLAGQSLIRSVSGTTRGLANNATALSFSYNDTDAPSLITVNLYLTNDEQTATIESTVMLRN